MMPPARIICDDRRLIKLLSFKGKRSGLDRRAHKRGGKAAKRGMSKEGGRSWSSVRFGDLRKVCEELFGKPRQAGTSHAIFKTPWAGDPRINIQER